MADRVWGASRGSTGDRKNPTDDITKMAMAERQSKKLKREDEVEEVKHEVTLMEAKAQKAEAEKKLRGENVMAEELKEEREKREAAQAALAASRQETMEARLGSRIEQLAEIVKSNKGSGKEFTEAFTQVTEAAKAVGWVPPTKEEPKTLADQLNQVVDMATKLGYDKVDRQSQTTLELERLKADNALRVEEMRDARDIRDKEWQLKLKQFDEDREHKKEEIEAKLNIERERNQLIANAITELKGFVSEIRGKGGGVAQPPPTNYVTAGVGETGELECPGCKAVIPVGGDDTTATCPGCGAAYPVRRIPKPPEPAAAGGEK